MPAARSARSALSRRPGRRQREKDPGSAFGPEAVPLATGSVPVVYWVPGPFPRPTPCPAGSAPQAPSARSSATSASGRLDADAPAMTCSEPDEPVGPASEPGAGLSSNLPLFRPMSTANLSTERYSECKVFRLALCRGSGKCSLPGRGLLPEGLAILWPRGSIPFAGRRRKNQAARLLSLRTVRFGVWITHLASPESVRPPALRPALRLPLEVMRMDGSADRFLDLMHQLEDFTRSYRPSRRTPSLTRRPSSCSGCGGRSCPRGRARCGGCCPRNSPGRPSPHDESELFEIGESG